MLDEGNLFYAGVFVDFALFSLLSALTIFSLAFTADDDVPFYSLLHASRVSRLNPCSLIRARV